MTRYAVAVFAGYLAGAIPFSYLIARAYGVDLREVGSGNVGATNCWRACGAGPGACAFACDFLKGFLPAFAFRVVDGEGAGLAAGAAAVLGHAFPVFLRGRGGKGVATGGGAFFALAPLASAGALLAFAIVGPLTTRTVSAGSVAAALVLPALSFLFYGPTPTSWAALVLGLFVVARHRENLARLWRGEEPKINRADRR